MEYKIKKIFGSVVLFECGLICANFARYEPQHYKMALEDCYDWERNYRHSPADIKSIRFAIKYAKGHKNEL